MKTVKHRMLFIWQYEDEENWLNEMAQNGLKLINVGFCRYVFEECKKGAYQFRLELLERNVTSNSGKKYVDFLDATGIEYIGHYGNWVYFSKKIEDGPFELFSDIDSHIAHYRRMLRLIIMVLFCACGSVGICSIHLWYETIGLYRLFGIGYGSLCILFSLLLILGAIRLNVRIKKLKNERAFRE